ncbi:MAG TPA: CPBP family intramembrane glutamic endopeptidase [Gemmata sp.]|nr:CPBP family intramembrane glutamic endopeptidase [Gemmata sp.]
MSGPIDEPPLVTRVEPTPTARPRPGLVGAILWSVLFMLVLLGALVCVGGVVLAVHAVGKPNPGQFIEDQLKGFVQAAQPAVPGGPPAPRPPIEMSQALAYGMLGAQIASLCFALLVLRQLVGVDWKRQIAIRKPYPLHLLLVALVVPAVILVSSAIQELVVKLAGRTPSAPEAVLGELFHAVPVWVTLLSVSIGPGVVEELWCRGYLGRGLCARYGLPAGILFTSMLFAAMHGDPWRIVVYTCMGGFLHFVYLASRSLWTSIVLHLLNNGIAVLMAVLPSWQQFEQELEKDSAGLLPVIYVASLALLIFASVALWTGRAKLVCLKHTESTDGTSWQPEYPAISLPPPGMNAAVAYSPMSRVAMILTLVSFGVLVFLLSRVAVAAPA